MHTVTLFIPALFWPHSGLDHDAPIATNLQRLLARSDAEESQCDGDEAWLCEQFGVPRQADWPIAPTSLFGTGRDPGPDFWLSADPVHLQVNRDQLTLLAPEALSISDVEAVSLCATLNRHFATQFTFVAPQSHRWYLQTQEPPRLRTSPLSQAVGREVDPLLPKGEDQLAWHRIFNEVQMVLHEHPINEEREMRGALPINSLWFSGGGILPRARTLFQAVIGDSPLARGLAKLTDIPFTPAGAGIAAIGARDVLVELQSAATASMCLDAAAWKLALEGLDRMWFAPLSAMLAKGQLGQIVIATVADGRSYRWCVSRMNLWRFWRVAVPLADQARTH